MKIEALSEDEIKELYIDWEQAHRHAADELDDKVSLGVLRMIYTYAVAQAEAEMWEFVAGHCYDDADESHRSLCIDRAKRDWGKVDWLAAVLTRIGWPKEGGLWAV